MSKSLLIVAHAPSPNTLRMREAAERGARDPDIDGVAVTTLSPFDTEPAHVLAADAILLGTTENLGAMSGALKDFFDRVYYPVLEEKQGLPCALYIRAGHDGTGARRGVESILTGLRWRMIGAPLLCKGPWRDEFEEACAELSATLAAGLEAGVF